MPLLDDATIRELLRTDYARLVNAVALVSGSFAAAEDAVQEAIVRAWTSRESIESPAAWVAVVAMNLSRSAWRRTFAERKARERLGGAVPVAQARSTTE
ncbi:MAG: sigma factor [Actinomycetota bacterium]